MRVYQFRHIRGDDQCSLGWRTVRLGQGVSGHLDRRWGSGQHSLVDPRFDEGDVAAVLGGLFELNAKLADIGIDVQAIRMLMENGDEEEEEPGDDDA